jgi:uncharacterized protein YfdQ (DUF2303 family)
MNSSILEQDREDVECDDDGFSNNSGAGAIIDMMERLHEPQTFTLEDPANDVIVVPKGMKVVSLKPYRDERRERPERISGTALLSTLDSFMDHVMRFKNERTVVFATEQHLSAVYDYHDKETAAWLAHRALYRFPYSDEWQAWDRVQDKQLTQAAFAELLESQIMDVAAPRDTDEAYFGEARYPLATPAQLMTLAKGLLVRVEMEAVARPNLSSGEQEVSYKESHSDSAGQALKVPRGFMLQIPCFRDGAAYRVPVRLRYRVVSGKVLWTIHLHRIDAVVRDAVKDACNTVEKETGVPLFQGSPEG